MSTVRSRNESPLMWSHRSPTDSKSSSTTTWSFRRTKERHVHFSTSSLPEQRTLQYNGASPSNRGRHHTSDFRGHSHWVWKVSTAGAPVIPAYHYIAWNQALSVKESNIDTITFRISEFLRTRSISAKYCSKTARAYCITNNLLQFSIQIWKHSFYYVIEMQRIQGDGLEFAKCRKALFEAIRSSHSSSSSKLPGIASDIDHDESPTSSLMDIEPECGDRLETFVCTSVLGDSPSKAAKDPDYCCPIRMCVDMLSETNHHHHFSDKELGLQCLSNLTDFHSTIPSEAVRASKFVLSNARLQSILRNFLVMPNYRRSPDFWDGSLPQSSTPHHALSRSDTLASPPIVNQASILTLKILGNSLECLSTVGNVKSQPQRDAHSVLAMSHRRAGTVLFPPGSLETPFWRTVLQVVCQNIERCCDDDDDDDYTTEQNGQNGGSTLEAYLSLRCLSLLQQLSAPTSITSVDKQGGTSELFEDDLHQQKHHGNRRMAHRSPSSKHRLALSSLYKIHAKGRQRHSALERESRRLLQEQQNLKA